MNEDNNPQQVSVDSQPAAAVVIEPTHQHHQINKIQKFLSNPKRRFLIFSVVFGVIGVVVLAASFASTSQERNLVEGFRKFAKTRPTLITGSTTMTYNNSPNLTNVGITYSTTLEPKTGNSAGKGVVTVNKTTFPYEYATISKDHYFKLGNTTLVKDVVRPTSPAYQYISTHQSTLDQVNNKWLVQPKQTTVNSLAGANYACTLNSNDIRLTATDAQKLQAAMLRNSPVKIQREVATKIGTEAVTESQVVMSSATSVDAFATVLSGLDAVKKIDSCAQTVAHTKAVPKVRDAFKNNNVNVSVFMNSSKVIKRITVSTSGKKATLKLSADFKYVPQPVIAKPAGAVPAQDFLRRMTTVVSASDQAKEADLYTINKAVEAYLLKNYKLPATLTELNITGLKNRLQDYTYGYTALSSSFGPNTFYRTCAVFTYPGLGGQVPSSPVTAAIFANHTAGRSCFSGNHVQGSVKVGAIPASPSDRNKEADLYTVNLAIENYIKKNNRLPVALKDLNVTGLKGSLGDIKYYYNSVTTNGGPTLLYDTCATFEHGGPGQLDKNSATAPLTAATYTAHEHSEGCYRNQYYKTESHIEYR